MTKNELKAHKRTIELELKKAERDYENSKTNHILHAIISIFSIGAWVVVWIIIALTNNARRVKLESLMDKSNHTLAEIEDSINELEAT
ncbi:hypothetical protein [Kaarinaea lacus]